MCLPSWLISAETAGNHLALKAFGIGTKLKERGAIYPVPPGLSGLTLACRRNAGIVHVMLRSCVPLCTLETTAEHPSAPKGGLRSMTQPSTTWCDRSRTHRDPLPASFHAAMDPQARHAPIREDVQPDMTKPAKTGAFRNGQSFAR